MSLSIAEAILEAAQTLRRGGVEEARREAGSLLAALLEKDRSFLILHAERMLAEDSLLRLREWTTRRAHGEPLQYITGHQEFFGLDFEVNSDVLIPRPETELLVETAMQLVNATAEKPLICDVGTGSGCIIISLLHERVRARGIAVDVSAAALRVAQRNAARHSVADRVSFIAGDGLAVFGPDSHRFDLIVSNPPYIAAAELPGLQREVRDHEPLLALTSGVDGLSMIKRLLHEAPGFLIDGGHMVLEIGFGQHEAIPRLLNQRIWKLTAVHNDLQAIPRTVVLQKCAEDS